jgi:phosphatidylinositol alpha-1,6-mannosyltransferase
VYPGVDARRFSPEADDGSLRLALAPRGELLLLSVGRLQRRKGHDLVLRALPELKKIVPKVRYVIVGDGNDRDTLQLLASELGIAGDVSFAGNVPDADLPAYFAACDVFVLPTRMESSDFEGFGIVFLEAAAAGKPSIGGRNGGVPEAIVDGETGILVADGAVDELLESLRALCTSADLRHRMGAMARERAVRDFSWDRAAAAVAAIHGELARSPEGE